MRGRGVEQIGGAPGLYDAPPLGMLSSCPHAMHMLLQIVAAGLPQVVLACGAKQHNIQSQNSFIGQLHLMSSYSSELLLFETAWQLLYTYVICMSYLKWTKFCSKREQKL